MNTPKDVIVAPPSTSRETALVVQGCVGIAILAILIGAAHRPADAARAGLNPWQKPFQLQAPEVQRVDRELLSALEEALRLRTPAAEWPSVQLLAKELVSPFSDRRGYAWELRRLRSVLNYLGRPRAGSGQPAFLLHIQEDLPHPGTTVLDEFHRRTEDGALIHVGVWVNFNPRALDDPVVQPEREGWTEIVLGADRSGER